MAACATPLAMGEGRRRETPRATKPHLRLKILQRKMFLKNIIQMTRIFGCLLYTSDAADDTPC
eukprot:1443593-Pyramimonas_sp.AAC.1